MSHNGECRKKLGAYFGCGSMDHLVKDCPSKLEFSTEQSVRSQQKFQNERILRWQLSLASYKDHKARN